MAPLDVCLLAGTLGRGGAERQLVYLVTALHEAGAAVRVLCLTKGEVWEGGIRALGVPVTWVGQPSSRVLRLRRIVAELRRRPPAILQSQHFYTNLYVVAAARVLGIREIGALRSNAVSEVRANGRLLGPMSLRAPRLLAANSHAGIRNAEAMGVRPERLRFLPNVVDTDRFRPGAPRDDTHFRLLTIGRLGPEKRLDRFLSILARVRTQMRAPVQGVIAGAGPLRDRLSARAAALGLPPGAVEFRGDVADPAPLYREADLFVLTSDWEGTPNVVLEAMASGLPVVATRVGDVPDLVADGRTGYVIDPEDEDGAVARVLELLADATLRRTMGAAARSALENTRGVHRLPGLLAELYGGALA